MGNLVAAEGSSQMGCYTSRCTYDGVLQLQLRDSDGRDAGWLSCPTPDALVPPPAAWGISGAVRCPSLAATLCNPHACPGLPCDDTDGCLSGVCTCGEAFGDACPPTRPAIPPLPPRPPSPLPSPPPPLPPLPPGGSYQSLVTFEAVIQGGQTIRPSDTHMHMPMHMLMPTHAHNVPMHTHTRSMHKYMHMCTHSHMSKSMHMCRLRRLTPRTSASTSPSLCGAGSVSSFDAQAYRRGLAAFLRAEGSAAVSADDIELTVGGAVTHHLT